MTPEHFKRRVRDLLETTNRYLDRARDAEALATYYKDRMRQWKASAGRALAMSSEATLALSLAKRDRDDALRKLADLQNEHDRLCGRNDYLSQRNRELTAEINGLRRVKHKKRGSFYRVVGDLSFQLAKPEHDIFTPLRFSKIREGATIRVYRSEDDGKLYGRFPDEFEDGRFEDAVTPTEEPAKPARQYYYNTHGCRAVDANGPDCICWHDEGTGPLATEPHKARSWRNKKAEANG